MTGPDQRAKEPEPVDKWVNVQTRIQLTQERKHLLDLNSEKEWEEEWEEEWAMHAEELVGVEWAKVPGEDTGEARVEIPGRIKGFDLEY